MKKSRLNRKWMEEEQLRREHLKERRVNGGMADRETVEEKKR